MIRLTDPTRIGPALAEVRALLGMSRHGVAKRIAQATGRASRSVAAQIWTWDNDGSKPGGCRPDLRSLGPYLDALDLDLALVDKADPGAPRTWPRLTDPPDDVTVVEGPAGTVWTRMDGGHYWGSKGWVGGVSWMQVLAWGPITEVKQ